MWFLRLTTLALAPLTLAAIVKEKTFASNLVRCDPAFHRRVESQQLRDVKGTLRSSRASTENILEWVVGHGAKVHDSLTVRPGGLSIKQETPPGTVLLTVPQSLTIQTNANESELSKTFQEEHVPLAALNAESHELRLAATLLVLTKAHNNTLAGYISSLPTPVDNREHNVFTAQTGLLASFQELPIAEMIKQYQSGQRKRFEEFTSMGGKVEPSDWDWADSLVRAKAFHHHGGLWLIPAVDLVRTTMDASRQNVEINMGDSASDEPIQVVAKQHLFPGMELLAPVRGTESMREETVSLRGDGGACSRLSQAVTKIMKGYNASRDCAAEPAQVSQKGAFCSLAGMAAMGCSECMAFPCKGNVCTCGEVGILGRFFAKIHFDVWSAAAERPFLLSICAMLFVVLVGIRSYKLIDALTPRSHQEQSQKGGNASFASKVPGDAKQKKAKIEGGLNLDHPAY